MKHIHMKKPDIKGFFQKIRNLKMQDIKEHFKERKERRRQILEKRRNGKFARKMQPVYRMMNRLSLVLHYLLACVLNFIIEIISRHSLFEAWDYLVGTPKVFFFNAFFDLCHIFYCISGQETCVCTDPAQCFLAGAWSLQWIYAA